MANGLLITLAACVGAGQQAMMLYKSTMEYFKPMMRSAAQKAQHPGRLAGRHLDDRAGTSRTAITCMPTPSYMSLAVGAYQDLPHAELPGMHVLDVKMKSESKSKHQNMT